MIHNLYDTSRNSHQTLTLISAWMILDPAMHQTLSSCCPLLGQRIATEHMWEGWSRARGHQRVEGVLENRKENSSLWEGPTVLAKVRQDAVFAFTSSLTLPSHLSILPSLFKTSNHEIHLTPSISSQFISPKSIPLLWSTLETPALPSVFKTDKPSVPILIKKGKTHYIRGGCLSCCVLYSENILSNILWKRFYGSESYPGFSCWKVRIESVRLLSDICIHLPFAAISQ